MVGWLFSKILPSNFNEEFEYSDHQQKRIIKQNIGSCNSEHEKEGTGIYEEKGVNI